jgi:hypothetical protein
MSSKIVLKRHNMSSCIMYNSMHLATARFVAGGGTPYHQCPLSVPRGMGRWGRRLGNGTRIRKNLQNIGLFPLDGARLRSYTSADWL